MPYSVYPLSYPQMNQVGVSGGIDPGIMRTGVPSPEPNQVTAYNSPTEVVSCSFDLQNDEYWAWIVWMDDQGWDWFEIDLVTSRAPEVITSKTIVRLLGPIEITKVGHDLFRAGCNFELLPGQEDDPAATQPPAVDIHTGRTPSTRPTDIVDSGDPASRTTDIYVSRFNQRG